MAGGESSIPGFGPYFVGTSMVGTQMINLFSSLGALSWDLSTLLWSAGLAAPPEIS